MSDLSRAGVAEIVERTTAGHLTACAVLDETLVRIAAENFRLNAFSRVLTDEARAEAQQRDALVAAGGAPGPLHGVPIAIKEELDVAGTVTTFGGEGNSTPAAADAEVVRLALHRVRLARTHPQPVGPDADPRRFQRRYGGRGRRRHGAGRHRRGRGRVDPYPERLLRPVHAETAARPRHLRTAPTPVVGAGHGRSVVAQRPGQRDRLRA